MESVQLSRVEASALRMMERIKIIPSKTGEAVKRREPNAGPLTETEFNTILKIVGKIIEKIKLIVIYIAILSCWQKQEEDQCS